MRTPARLTFLVAFAVLVGVASVPASHATEAETVAPAQQGVAKYVLHVGGMT